MHCVRRQIGLAGGPGAHVLIIVHELVDDGVLRRPLVRRGSSPERVALPFERDVVASRWL